MSEKNKVLDIDDLQNVTGGFGVRRSEMASPGEGMRPHAQAVEYTPFITESIFGGVSRDCVAVSVAQVVGRGQDREFIQKVNNYLQDKLDHDPHYFRYNQILRMRDIEGFKK